MACDCDRGIFIKENVLIISNATFRSEDTSGQHLGLGLAVSRVLCQKHGGTIELSNQPPHGACVKASIKLQEILYGTALITGGENGNI